MYGLSQAGQVADDHLQPCLVDADYNLTAITATPGLFKHAHNSIIFGLVVDDFIAQHTAIEDLHHFEATLRKHYKITVDYEAPNSVG